MADITISDLELAPALADDMVFPVENTTDTYASTLAMLRRLLNKTFVEVENADFNDGYYQCTGTPTNSPEAGAINWTLQVSAESGVVVQRAFSLDDNFANMYIRRWNGVTWTGWLEVGEGKADIDASNFNDAGRSLISGLSNPSMESINLITTGAINTAITTTAQTYIAPASGVIEIINMGNNYILLISSKLQTRCGAGVGSVVYAHANVSKGDTVYIRTDTGTATLSGAAFIYANGEV